MNYNKRKANAIFMNKA